VRVHRTVPIQEFCQTGSGTTPSRKKKEAYYGGTVPWVKSGELREGLITTTEEHVTEQALRETALRLAPKGALLVAMYGATVGRVARLGLEATTNQAVCHIIPDPELADEQYLFHALQAKAPELIARGVGGAQPNIRQGTIKGTAIYLPPLPEQRRIAAILDQADALRRLRRQSLSRLSELGLAIFVERFGRAGAFPSRKIGEFANVKGGKRLPKGAEYSASPTAHPYIRVSNLSDGIIETDGMKFISEDVHQTVARYIVQTNDVLISIAGTIGVVAPVRANLDRANLTENAAKITPKVDGAFDPDYLTWALQTPQLRQAIRASTGQVTIGKLALFRIEDLSVPMPKIEVQREFSRQMQGLESERVTFANSLVQAEALFASLQHRAFRGEL